MVCDPDDVEVLDPPEVDVCDPEEVLCPPVVVVVVTVWPPVEVEDPDEVWLPDEEEEELLPEDVLVGSS